jgi:Fe-S-cluster containining protein
MSGDQALIQIVDAALAEAARKSGAWLVCRPGCTDCCMGPFPITQLDARRLREGLAELESRDRQRAARVRERARQAVVATATDDDPCPALDPSTGTCDLYAARPITCRIFGPPVRYGSDAVGICELCFRGASDEEIAACQVEVGPGLESQLSNEVEETTGVRGETSVAFALVAASEAAPR